ncbi:hypothetical protein [Rhizobium paknamense]|uniref:Type III secretion protein n=1 Tax=Rhizobium paknamense TaxID=1206817 RepID=A0ABU0IFH1_9HYPH|nr:hypothetical protein [Rhizobium paknamense]MDQ0456398.1 hypothetical protein [Rhizobium paknamense]
MGFEAEWQALLKIRRSRADNRRRAFSVAERALQETALAVQHNQTETEKAAQALDEAGLGHMAEAGISFSGESLKNLAARQEVCRARELDCHQDRLQLQAALLARQDDLAAARQELHQAERKLILTEEALDLVKQLR